MLAGLTARLQGLIVGQDALTLERSKIRAQSESEPGIYLQVSTIEVPHTFLECNVNGRHEKRGHPPAYQHQEGGLKVGQLSMAYSIQHWPGPRDHGQSGTEGQVLLTLDCTPPRSNAQNKHLLAAFPALFNSCALIRSLQWAFPFCFKVNWQLKKKLNHFDHFTNSAPEMAGSRVVQILCTHR